MTKQELFKLIDLKVDGLRNKAIIKDAIEDYCSINIKQQILDAFNQGYREGENDGSIGCVYNDDVAKHSDAADYWQETYDTTVPKQNQ
jgi:hypothetical protein